MPKMKSRSGAKKRCKPTGTGKFKRNHASRQAALDSIRRWPDRKWTARIGGRVRGHEVAVASRAEAEQRVNDYYNEIMMKFVADFGKEAG